MAAVKVNISLSSVVETEVYWSDCSSHLFGLFFSEAHGMILRVGRPFTRADYWVSMTPTGLTAHIAVPTKGVVFVLAATPPPHETARCDAASRI